MFFSSILKRDPGEKLCRLHLFKENRFQGKAIVGRYGS